MVDIANLRKTLSRDYERLRHKGGWREVGRERGISGAMAYRIANSDYEPKEAHARFLLGLPAMVSAPACSDCGEVHVAKRCTNRKVNPRPGKHNIKVPDEVWDWLRRDGNASAEIERLAREQMTKGEGNMEQQARERIDDMGFTDEELDFIFADWPNWDEHINWLLTATREEIVSWIAAGE